jgi:hypothetical protein
VTMIGPARDVFQFVHDRSERHPMPEEGVVLLLSPWGATLDDEVCVDEVVQDECNEVAVGGSIVPESIHEVLIETEFEGRSDKAQGEDFAGKIRFQIT